MERFKNLKTLSVAVVLVTVLNVFHSFFLPQYQYKPISISYQVTSEFDTWTWLSVRPYNSNIELTERKQILANTAQTIEFKLSYKEGVDLIGIFWNYSNKGNFIIEKFLVKDGDKITSHKKINEIISYTSKNINSQNSSESVFIATSSEQANGWIMVKASEISNLAKTKKFKPLLFETNVILLMLIFALLKYSSIKINRLIESFKESGLLKSLRVYLFYLWVFLIPFWIIISHTLFAISLVLLIIEFIRTKSIFSAKKIWIFVPLWIFACSLLVNSHIVHTIDISENLGDYFYFLLSPFLFYNLKKDQLNKMSTVFTIGVFTYLFLLTVAIFERYYSLNPIAFKDFFFNVVNQYWHSSYLSLLVFLAALFYFKKEKRLLFKLLSSIFILAFFYFSDARLPFLISIFFFGYLILNPKGKKINKKGVIIFFSLVLLTLTFNFNSVKNGLSTITDKYLYTKTDNLDSRIELWKAAKEVVKEMPVLGIGDQNVKSEIFNHLRKDSVIKFRNYNAHNQYIEILLANGWIVLFLFLVVIFVPFVKGYKNFIYFFTFFSICMLVESYLNRQAGLIIFSFWYSFLIYYDRHDK